MTPSAEEQRGLRLLAESGEAIVAGVERELAGWVEREVARILDAWGRADPATRARAERDAVDAGRAAATRVEAELHTLFALDPGEQRATPLEIVRSAYREPTVVLEAAGIPAGGARRVRRAGVARRSLRVGDPRPRRPGRPRAGTAPLRVGDGQGGRAARPGRPIPDRQVSGP